MKKFDPSRPRPLQIVHLDMKENRVEVVEESLRYISDVLMRCGAESVCVISIMGTYRTGKSFLLDLLMRYLRAAERGADATAKAKQETAAAHRKAERFSLVAGKSKEEASQAGRDAAQKVAKTYGNIVFPPPSQGTWHSGEDAVPPPKWVTEEGVAGSLEGCRAHRDDGARTYDAGFDWQGGMDKCTEGIWLWSVPFVLPREDGRKVAVLLMDTQGAWDGAMSKDQSATIFGLTSLLSSKIIYNMQNIITDDKIDNLDYFTTFARAACSTMPEGSEAPFGELEFLVRDWPWYEDGWDHKQCQEQMAQHLRKLIGAEHAPEDRRETVNRLGSIFRYIGCTGLVHPGMKVLKPSFKGDLKDIESDFLQLLDEFARKVFGGDFPRPSSPLGSEITCSTFGNVVTNFVEAFRQNKGTAVSLREAFVKVEIFRHRDELLKQFHIDLQRIAPETAVLDQTTLARAMKKLRDDSERNYRMRLMGYKLAKERTAGNESMPTEEEEMGAFMKLVDEALSRRELINRNVVEGATLKLVASPVVGSVGYFLLAHHLILYPFLAIGGYLQLQRNAARNDRSILDKRTIAGVAKDVKEWFACRWRDLQAIQIVLINCSPGNAMEQFKGLGHAATAATAAARQGLGRGVSSPAAATGARSPAPELPSSRAGSTERAPVHRGGV